MPIPVPIPGTPLTITDTDSAKAELLLVELFQIFKNGTTGGSPALQTPATLIPSNPDPVGPPVGFEADTPEKQLYFRQLALALVQVVPLWVTPGGGGPIAEDVFSASCSVSDLVGDFVYMNAGLDVRKVDITDDTPPRKIPAVGVIIEKPTTTTCKVQTAGICDGIYAGLTPNAAYWVGTDSRPTLTKPTGSEGSPIFVIPIGYALSTTKMLLVHKTTVKARS